MNVISQQRIEEALRERDPGTAEETWRRFADPESDEEFYAAWLDILCEKVGGVAAAVLLVTEAESGALAPLAVYPHPAADVGHLRDAAGAALSARAGAVHRPGADGSAHLAYPIVVGDEVTGIVVLELAPVPDKALSDARRTVLWGVGWLECAVWRRRALADSARIDRAAIALDMLGAAEEHPRLEAATMAVANALAARLDLASVAIGLFPTRRRRDAPIRVWGLSSTAWFPKKSPGIRLVANAMEEAIDQNVTVVYPVPEGERAPITAAHAELGRARRGNALATFAMVDENAPTGAILVERKGDAPLDRETRLILEAVAALIGPVLALKSRQQRLISGRIVDRIGDAVRAVFGRRRPSLKLAATAGVVAVLFVCLYQADFEVSADAAVEGLVQRSAVAPFAGFLHESGARAGDIVKEGQVLAALDDRDLRLEELKWQSEQAQLERQRRRALAESDRAEAALLSAQIRQAEAQIRLAAEKRKRTVVRAPISGLVLSGDLSQRLGAPVEQGETMFVIAPLDRYRLVLRVAEGDLRHLHIGQSGHLLLSGITDRRFPITVMALTSVAEVIDGQNVFRVEGSIENVTEAVRPGMEGVAKVKVDERSLISIWTRGLIDWLRFFIWTWVP